MKIKKELIYEIERYDAEEDCKQPFWNYMASINAQNEYQQRKTNGTYFDTV